MVDAAQSTWPQLLMPSQTTEQGKPGGQTTGLVQPKVQSITQMPPSQPLVQRAGQALGSVSPETSEPNPSIPALSAPTTSGAMSWTKPSAAP